MKLLLILLFPFGCMAQGFGLFGPGFHQFTKAREPAFWLDVKQFIATNAPDDSLATNFVDFSGHGISMDNATTVANGTNFHYWTRYGGVIGGNGGASGGITCQIANSNLVQRYMLKNKTNEITMAFRLRYRTGNMVFGQTGNLTDGGGQHYPLGQMSASTIFFDFGSSVYSPSGYRISKAKPGDFDDTLVNVFFIRSKTNQDIWMGGPTGAVTNWLSGYGDSLITNGPSGDFTLMNANSASNCYYKRVLIWDYPLPPSDIAMWNRHMTYLP